MANFSLPFAANRDVSNEQKRLKNGLGFGVEVVDLVTDRKAVSVWCSNLALNSDYWTHCN